MKSRWLLLSTFIVATLALGLWMLPILAGSNWVYQPLVDRLADQRFRLTIQKAQLGWFTPISIDGIVLSAIDSDESDSKTAELVKIRSVRCQRSLLGFLWHFRDLGRIDVDQPNVNFQLLEDGSNLQRIIDTVRSAPQNAGTNSPSDAEAVDTRKTANTPRLDVSLHVSGLHVTLQEPSSAEPVVVVPAFDLDLSYQSLGVPSQVVVEPATVLKQVEITSRLISLGLARAVPLLAQSTDFDGQVTLETDRITIPLDNPHLALGSARLTMHQVRSIPTAPVIVGALDLMGRLFKTQVPHEFVFVDGSVVNVRADSGVIHHDGVRAGLPKVDQRLQIATEGNVGLLDRKLELNIEIPVPVEQLARRQSVRQLGVPSMTLPVRGTLDKPELDWNTLRQDSSGLLATISDALGVEAPLAASAVDVLSRLADGQTDQTVQAGVEILQQLMQRRKQSRRAQQENSSTDQAPPPEESQPGPLRRRLRDAFRGD